MTSKQLNKLTLYDEPNQLQDGERVLRIVAPFGGSKQLVATVPIEHYATAKLMALAPEMAEALRQIDTLCLKLCMLALNPKIADHTPAGLEDEVRDFLRSGTHRAESLLSRLDKSETDNGD